jgi:uncharacterized RDD family membrane protein YckC
MDNGPTTPARPTPPPPDLPRYTPPLPSLAIPPAAPPPAIPPAQQAAKLQIRVAPESAIDLTPDGALAPFNTRVIAAVIDLVLAGGLCIAAWMVLPGFCGASMPWLVGLAYLVTRDSLPMLGGQSVGKKAMKLQAVTLDGKSLIGNWESALIRNAVLAIPLFPLVELVVLLIRKDKPEHDRRLGDEWAKTQVILAPDPTPAG